MAHLGTCFVIILMAIISALISINIVIVSFFTSFVMRTFRIYVFTIWLKIWVFIQLVHLLLKSLIVNFRLVKIWAISSKFERFAFGSLLS